MTRRAARGSLGSGTHGLALVAATVTAVALTTVAALAAPGPAAGAERPTPVAVCAPASSDVTTNCLAEQLQDSAGRGVSPAEMPAQALSSTDIRQAYGLGDSRAGGRAVAVVAAGGYPALASDLATYREAQGLPPCGVEEGCLRILDQRGGQVAPPVIPGWPVEQALDVDAVSATCPDCRIVVVQASSAGIADLATAVATAAAVEGVVAISNSYTTPNDQSDRKYGTFFDHPGVVVTAAVGDTGPGRAGYPASSRFVVAVGGTTLSRAPGTARGWEESAWLDSRSGCSGKNGPPVGQAAFATGCKGRAVADLSAVADPITGLAVYAPTSTGSAWMVVGGTSLAAPVIAAIAAQVEPAAGTSASPRAVDRLYAAPSPSFNDVTSGAVPGCRTVLCAAGSGWDGLTGRGTPRGTAPFALRAPQ